MNVYVLYNSLSNNGRGLLAAEKVKSIWAEKQLLFNDITEIKDYNLFLKELKKDDRVLICGGDGTLNHFVNCIDEKNIKNDIYFFATGSGNDLWRDLGLDKDSPPVLINEYIINLPVVSVKHKTYKFINNVGFGIDGYCCKVGDEMRAKDEKEINYTAIAIKGLLFRYKPTDATVIVDGKKYEFKHVWLAPTMNGRYYGGGMKVTPDQDRKGSPRKLSVAVMYGSNKIKTLAVFPSIFEGKHVEHTEMVKVLTGNDITVEFKKPSPLQIDGETVLGVKSYHAQLSAEQEKKKLFAKA